MLGGLATLAGQPVTVAMPGVVLAMVSSLAVRETEPVPQAVAIALLASASIVAVSLGAAAGGTVVLGDAVFVAVAVFAVFLQRLGSRGMATGMVAFISYFLALFIQVSLAQLPAVAVALLVGALVCILVRVLLRPRHPARDLRRMLAALGIRAGGVIELFDQALREGGFTPRLAHRLRSRVEPVAQTAMAVEQPLDGAAESLLETIGNDELGVRVFDLQLEVEGLGTSVGRLVASDAADPAVREEARAALTALRTFLQAPARQSVIDSLAGDAEVSAVPDADAVRFHRAVVSSVEAWRRVVDPRPDDSDSTSDELTDDPDGGEGGSPPTSLGDTARRATQVGVASTLAIVVGTQLSSTRWYWAVITAFVVYIGTTTRGEILSKGWQRVLGTVAGVVAGVLVPTVVGGNTVLAVLLIMVCLFLGVYLLAVSAAIMMFFITTMLTLLYGLLGMFSVDLLLVRLDEPLAGALIGILVCYVVFPASTRTAARDGVRDFLEELGEMLARSVDAFTAATPSRVVPGAHARELRDTFDQLQTTVQPLIDGLAGSPTGPDRGGRCRCLLPASTTAGSVYGAAMKRLLAVVVSLYVAAALGTRAAEMAGMHRCDCSTSCWCRRPTLSAFRWVMPLGHR